MTDERLIPFGLGFLGIGLVCLAMFLPYLDASSVGFSEVAENTMLQASYGWITLILAGSCAISLIRTFQSPRRVYWPLISGLLLIGSAVYNATDKEARTLCPIGATEVSEACQVASPGLGIYVLGIGGVALLGSGLFLVRFPKRLRGEGEPDPLKVTRECPHCKSSIRPDATVCPHCQRESSPWTLHEDAWWRQEAGEWQRLNTRQSPPRFESPEERHESQTRTCPHCGEEMPARASVCSSCNRSSTRTDMSR